ncbi:MAG: ATP-binding protein [Desulfuromonadales bacterium]
MSDHKKIFFGGTCITGILLLWIFLWFQYTYDSRQATIAAETTVSNLSKAFEENILGTIRHLDEFLVTLRRDYPQHQEQIADLITSYNRHSVRELIIQLSITDARGVMVYNTKGMPDKALDLSDREHIRVQMNSREDHLFISKPVMGRVSKKWSIQFTRKMMNRDGAFAGVVVLSVDPDYFTSFYRSIDVGSRGVITLLGMDGVIRARSSVASGGKDPIGSSISGTNILINPADPPVGIYHAPSIIDGVPRIVSYRRLKNYPLVVRVAFAEDEALSALHWHRLNIILQGMLATGGLLLIFWLALRLNTRQQQYTLELETINTSLQQRINETVAELRQKDQVMISQSRQAAMGEMIGNIAHQWRQPLNALAMVLGNIQQAHQYNELTDGYLRSTVESGNRLIQKMSTTINDFRNFFQPDKEMVTFSAREQINQAVSLVGASFSSQNIHIHLEAEQDLMLPGFQNEYSQVLLNLLSNSRDAIKGSGVPEGHITMRLFERDGQGCVAIGDNGGGIPEDVISRIFEPYFSTKSMGTGIGLYMSKMIIERSMNGTIEAHNIDGGAEFVVVTPLAETGASSC